MEYKLTVQNVNDTNRRHKYLAAVDSLAKAMKVPVSLKPKKSDKEEKFPYRSYQDLVQKWVYYYAGMLDQIYDTACEVFDLPKIQTFSKAAYSGKLMYKGKILYQPDTGLPITNKQWNDFVKALDRYLNQGLENAGDRIVLDSQALGKILDRMLKYQSWGGIKNTRLEDMLYKKHNFDYLSDERNYRKVFGVPDYEADRLTVAKEHCAMYIRGIEDQTRTAIKKTFIAGIKERKSKSAVSQDLFDKFGSLNKDWQRIVETETNDNLNTGILLSERTVMKEGDKLYFQRIEMKDEITCDHCNRINGMVVLWSDTALEDERIQDQYADVAIWEGKTRVGHGSKDEWVAAGSQHPWCRGLWTKWNQPEEGETISLHDAAIAKMKSREAAWGAAVKQATSEFNNSGTKNPDDTTAGFRERINELYNASGENDKGKWAKDWFKNNWQGDE